MADKTQFNAEDYLKNMYDSSLASQKEQLAQDYEQNVSDLEAQKEAARKQTDENLTRTYVEAAKAQKNYNEVQNAYGLTSGAMAQARLAQDNQLQADLTAIRTAQQSVDADVERQRSLLSKEYQSAIAEAQANNDLARAEALFEQAKAEDERLKEQQLAAANLMAGAGDYSLIGQLYGLTPEQIAKLQGETTGGPYAGPDDDPEEGWGDGVNDAAMKAYELQFRTMMQAGRYDLVEARMANIMAQGKLSEKQAQILGDILISGGYVGG